MSQCGRQTKLFWASRALRKLKILPSGQKGGCQEEAASGKFQMEGDLANWQDLQCLCHLLCLAHVAVLGPQ